MERATIIFWALVAALLGMSVFYGVNAWRFTAANQQKDGMLASGDVVRLINVLDGDTLVVAKEGQGNTTVRLLGIKTFESKHGKDEAASTLKAQRRGIDRSVRSCGEPVASTVLVRSSSPRLPLPRAC